MNLKPQDILFLLKLVALRKKQWSFNKLAVELDMSPAEVHAAAKRTLAAKLAVKQGGNILPNIRNLEEFLFFGIQYVFVPELSGLSRGMPTSYGYKPLSDYFQDNDELLPVWPDAEGKIRGESFSPLYRSVVMAAKNDDDLYQLLALVDAIRGGQSREKKLAKKELLKRLQSYEKISKPKS